MPTRANTHQTHQESLVLLGKEGLDELNNKIEALFDIINGKKNTNFTLTNKIDGAPGLLIGKGINGYPFKFVGIKSVLSGPKNAYSTREQIIDKFADKPNLAKCLIQGLSLAEYVPNGVIIQGDCLFTSDTLKERIIDGESYITFQPNKIIYAYNAESPDSNKIKKARFGICFHTVYKGTPGAWTQSFRVPRIDVPSEFFVMFPDTELNIDSAQDLSAIKEKYSRLKELEAKLLATDDYQTLVNNKEFITTYWNTFENKFTSDKATNYLNVNTLSKDLLDFAVNRRDKMYRTHIAKLKKPQSIEDSTSKYEQDLIELETIIKGNKSLLELIANAFNLAAEIKMDLYDCLLKSSKVSYKTKLQKVSGAYVDSDGEGFSLSDPEGNIVKLVDRSKFSNANRSSEFTSGFDHLNESYLVENSLLRLYQHLNKGTNFAVVGTLDKDDTKVSHYKDFYYNHLLPLNKQHIGFKHLLGTYTMQNTGELVIEDSFVIYNIDKATAIELGKASNQESIIWKDDNFFGFIYMEDGKEENVLNRELDFKDTDDFSSKMNSKKPGENMPFKFGMKEGYDLIEIAEQVSVPGPNYKNWNRKPKYNVIWSDTSTFDGVDD